MLNPLNLCFRHLSPHESTLAHFNQNRQNQCHWPPGWRCEGCPGWHGSLEPARIGLKVVREDLGSWGCSWGIMTGCKSLDIYNIYNTYITPIKKQNKTYNQYGYVSSYNWTCAPKLRSTAYVQRSAARGAPMSSYEPYEDDYEYEDDLIADISFWWCI